MNEAGLRGVRRFVTIVAMLSALFILPAEVIAQTSAGTADPTAAASLGPLASIQTEALRQSLVGKWIATVGDQTIFLKLNTDATYSLGRSHGTFQVEPGTLVLTDKHGRSQNCSLDLANGQLTLKGVGITGSIVFTKRTELRTALSSWFAFSPGSLAAKLWHILVIVLIVIAARLIILLAQWISYLAVFSDTGLFSLLYRNRKNRARTIHLLVLNLIKYVIYFTALGLVLAEVGVNTTAYLASLSVIGLAIGFGSQGLVQDMVTGFFILFEGQYDVGDMVDVSGQTGVVTEIGLRMTRLRNYLGQTIVIPNRNIAVVGNYFKGAQVVSVDLALAPAQPVEAEASDDAAASPAAAPPALGPEDFERARAVMCEVAAQVRAEFVGIVLEEPTAETIGNDDAGRYLRLELSIWPGQAWLVDNQLIPRLRESFTAQKMTIQGDRVTAFYHARIPVERILTWRWAGLKRKA